MPRRPTFTGPLATVAFWPVGVALTSWRYMWRTTPMHRREVPGSRPEDDAPLIPAEVDQDRIQRVDQGVGPQLRRRYRARVRDARLDPRDLFARVAADPNRTSPGDLARFHKVRGEAGAMRIGDEYVVRMPGPWNGPVRVVDVTPTSYRVATLDGHLEAGQLEFRVSGNGELELCVESWMRSGDRLSELMHHRLLMAKEVQVHMWTSFLEGAAELSGGRMTGGIDIDTRVLD